MPSAGPTTGNKTMANNNLMGGCKLILGMIAHEGPFFTSQIHKEIYRILKTTKILLQLVNVLPKMLFLLFTQYGIV